MGTTGTYIADPTLAEYGDEAFERAGIQPQSITAEHIASLRRSIGFVFSEWATQGPQQWTFGILEHTVTAGENNFTLPQGTIDVRSVTVKRDSRETEMTPMSRAEYHVIHDKTIRGRPTSYFTDRKRGTPSGTTPSATPTYLVFYYWQAAENATDIIRVQYFSQIQDVASGNMAGTFDIPFRWQEAFASALAAKVAQKFKPERFDALKALADIAFKMADGSETEKAPLHVTVDYGGRGRRRR